MLVWKMNRVTLKLCCCACCVDSGARGPIQGICAHNGEYPCSWCLHSGSRQDDNSRKFPLLDDGPPPPRSQESILDHARELVERRARGERVKGKLKSHVCGVKSVSPLVTLPHFHLVNGMIVDVLHCCWLEISRQMAKAWFDSDSEAAYYFGAPNTLTIVNRRLAELTCPVEVRRLPWPVDDMSFWKGKEWENWALFLQFACARRSFARQISCELGFICWGFAHTSWNTNFTGRYYSSQATNHTICPRSRITVW